MSNTRSIDTKGNDLYAPVKKVKLHHSREGCSLLSWSSFTSQPHAHEGKQREKKVGEDFHRSFSSLKTGLVKLVKLVKVKCPMSHEQKLHFPSWTFKIAAKADYLDWWTRLGLKKHASMILKQSQLRAMAFFCKSTVVMVINNEIKTAKYLNRQQVPIANFAINLSPLQK